MKKTVFSIITCGIVMFLNAGGNSLVVKSKPIAVNDSFFIKKYIGIGFGINKVKTQYFGSDKLFDINLRMGVDFNDYLGLVAIFSKGINDRDELSHTYSYGIYLKPRYRINQKVALYALTGYAKSKVTYKNEAKKVGIMNNYTKQDSFSYGFGVDYKINSKVSLDIDYVHYIKKSHTDSTGRYALRSESINLIIKYSF